MPDVPVVMCNSCNHFFHEEDWEFAVMQKKACPYCGSPIDSSYGSGSVSMSDVADKVPDSKAVANGVGGYGLR